MDDCDECTRGVEDEGVELADDAPEVGCSFGSVACLCKLSTIPLLRVVVIRSK